MAVDVMHLDPGQSFANMAFGKCQSTEELSREHAYPTMVVSPSDSPTSTHSLMDLSLTSTEQQAVERLQSSRNQLQQEIEHLIGELTTIGEEMNCTAECIQIIQDSEEASSKKLMRRGRKLFNAKPKEGMKFLIEKGLVNSTAEDLALFLFVSQLDKKAIGDYLGEGKEFNITVLHEFVRLHKFHGLDLVQALRVFLTSFQLPGEAQKIDRMMESFAHRYCECNPGTFSNTDCRMRKQTYWSDILCARRLRIMDTEHGQKYACYILSFAIIMLNTSLHNPNVKHKPTVEQFISMNRDINNGKELPSEMLRGHYDAIKVEPFQYQEGGDELSEVFFNPDHQGWLIKEGGKHKSWCKRWFILTDNCLYYFKSPSDKEPRGIIPLENLEIRECLDGKRNYCFEICLTEKLRRGTLIKACKTNADGKVVVGHHLHYRIQASSEQEMGEWMKRIRASISRNPFLEMLQQRRQRVSKKGPVGL